MDNSANRKQEDEISLRDVIRKAQDLLKLLKRYWILLTVLVLIFTTIGYLYADRQKTLYIAQTSFALEGSKGSNGIASYMQLAGQLGLTGSSPIVIDDEKLIRILKSKRILIAALHKKAIINNKQDLLANHFFNIYDFKKRFELNPELRDIQFSSDSLEFLTKNHRVVLGTMIGILMNYNLVISKEEQSGIMLVTVRTESEQLSKYLCDAIIQTVTEFYITNKTQKEINALKVIQSRTDSLEGAFYDAQNEYAKAKDANYRLIKAQGFLKELKLKREVEILNLMYGEAVKALEASKMNLMLSTPIIQLIDKPEFPLSKYRPNNTSMALRGSAAGLLIGFFIILIIRLVKKPSQSEEN